MMLARRAPLTTIPFSLAMALPVMFRRQHPGGAFAAVVAVGAAEVAVLSWRSDLSVLVLLHTLAASRPRRLSVAGLAVCLLGSVVALARWEAAKVTHAEFMLGTLAALFVGPALRAWLLGDSMKWRRGWNASGMRRPCWRRPGRRPPARPAGRGDRRGGQHG
ncbi:MAG TPA: hypothetical protein VGM79_32315 [Streptosporangiaceae bacterium]|jgi:lysylphosphatidylglycerol synthetase-like protein (DUF2156 family)